MALLNSVPDIFNIATNYGSVMMYSPVLASLVTDRLNSVEGIAELEVPAPTTVEYVPSNRC
jgi:hypothetical protein